MLKFNKALKTINFFIIISLVSNSAYCLPIDQSDRLRIPLGLSKERQGQLNRELASDQDIDIYDIKPELVLKAMAGTLKDKLKGTLWDRDNAKIVDVGIEDLPYPRGVNIGLTAFGLPGIEQAALLATTERLEGANFLFVSPFGDLFFGKKNPDMLFAKHAVFINKEKKIILGRFKEPILIHAMEHAVSTARSAFYDKGIPLLNSPEAMSFTNDKINFGDFLKDAGLEFEVLEEGEESTMLLHIQQFMGDKQEIVLKPHDSSGGSGVGMFSEYELDDAVTHAKKLLGRKSKVIIQERVSNELWQEEGLYIDWNLRVLTTWDGERLVIDEDMIEVRYKPYGKRTVSLRQGANAIRLSEFFANLNFSEEGKKRFLEGVKKRIEPKAIELEEKLQSISKSPYKHTGLVGWDLIMSDEQEWYILEANTGSVGGIETIEKMAPEEKKGNVVIAIARHLLRLAQDYYNLHTDILTDSEGEPIYLLDDAAFLNNFATVFSTIGEDEIVLAFIRKALELEPQNILLQTNLGRTLYSVKKHDDAIVVLEDVLSKEPDDIMARISLAFTLIEKGGRENYIRAHYIASGILNENEKSVRAFQIIARTLIRLVGDMEEALEDAFDALVRIHDIDMEFSIKSCAGIWDSLAVAYIERGDLERAEHVLKQAFERTNKTSSLYLHYGSVLFGLGKIEEGRTVFYKLMKHFLRSNGQGEEAFRIILELDGENEIAWKGLVLSLYQNEKIDDERYGHLIEAINAGDFKKAEELAKVNPDVNITEEIGSQRRDAQKSL